MAKYLVCVEGDEDVIDEAREVEATSLEDAAERYVEYNYANLDYPDEVEVFVKRKGVDAAPVKHNVCAIQDVRFRATVSSS